MRKGMLAAAAAFAASPQGRRMIQRGRAYLRSPEGRRKIAELRARVTPGSPPPKAVMPASPATPPGPS
jgi:hypothetical protein